VFKNVASQKFRVFAFDAATGLPKSGDAANITAYVSKDYGTVTVLGDTSATEEDATNAKGYYLFDATQAETNADVLMVSGKSSTSGVVVVGAPAVIATYPTTGILAPATAGRTLVVDAAGLADANAVKVGPSGSGTAQTARDLGASVLLSSGTGTGQVKLSSGYVAPNWGDVGNPTTSLALTGTTIATTQKVDVETIKTNPVVNAGTVTFPTTATLASTTNITAGTITTVTNLTNAPSSGDFTATMKTSIGTAVAASAVASVTGNVGGSVASVATGGITSASFAAGAITASAIAADAIGASELAADAVAEIAAGVWDLATSGHTTSGTFGAAAVAAGGAGDPSSTALPGSYGAGTAGYIIGNNLNATVSSRSTYAGGDTSGVTTLLTRIGGAITISGGKVAATMGATDYSGNTVQTGDAYARLGAPAGASVSADVAAVKSDSAAILDDTGTSGVVVASGSKAGYSLAAAGMDGVVVETGLNARQSLSVIAAALTGVLSGAATTTVTIKGAGVATTRVTATVDSDGDRSAVTLNPPA